MFSKLVREIKKRYRKIKGDKLLLLAPKVLNNDVVNHYVKELGKLIKNKDVTNVALSGNYGTGKSSIIKTFINKKYHKNKYIVVTIGSFLSTTREKANFNLQENTSINHEEKQNGNEEENTTQIKQKEEKIIEQNITNKSEEKDSKVDPDELEMVDKIEQSILKQLIHLNSANEMPGSKLKRILYDKVKIYRYFYLIIVPLIFFVCNSFEYHLKCFVSCDWTIKSNKFVNGMLIIYVLVFIITLYRILEKLINRIDSIEIKNNNYNIKFDGERDLAFNKNLYELVYFFIKNKPEAIFFEDIDRFSEDVVVKVIEELKELNCIVNNAMSRIVFPKKVTFVYSFRDDIFSDMKERSKFYDYISSVMIISTGYNSLVQLYSLLEQKNIGKNEISNKLIGIVSKYITDIRTLICIVNDYCTFKKILKIQKYDKIFAMCAYKNYYFNDYTHILNRNNKIEKSFLSVENKIKNLLNSKEEELVKIQDMISKKRTLNKIGILELKRNFWNENEYLGYLPTAIIINSKKYKVNQFESDEFDIELLDENIRFQNQYDPSYKAKKESLDYFLTSINLIKSDEWEQKEKLLQEEKNVILNSSYKTIYNKYFELNNLELIDELIINKYIEKDYIDFITAPTITSKLNSLDNKFMFDVQHGSYSFDTNINNPEEIKFFLSSYFEDEHILNFKLISYLLHDAENENSQSIECLNKIIEQFKKFNSNKLDFLFQYYEKNWGDCFFLLIKMQEKNINLFNIFNELDIENKGRFSNFISEMTIIIENAANSIEKKEEFRNILTIFFKTNLREYSDMLLSKEIVRKNLISLNYKFNDISYFNEENLKFIYEKKLYSFNEQNLKRITNKNNLKEFKDFNGYENLIEYIKNNINDFGKEYYLQSSFRINQPEIIESILKNDHVDISIKNAICQRESFYIDLKNIKSNIYENLFNHNHVKVNWNNIVILKGKVSDNKLIDFIIENYKTLINKNKIKNILELDNDFIKNILTNLIKNKLHDEADLIIKNFSDKSIIKYPSLPKDNNDYFIKNNLIQFNAKNLKQIIALNNNVLLLEYLENWYKENNNIIEIMKGLKYDFNKLKLLLSSSTITNYDKLEIINKIYLKNDKSVDVIKEIIYIAFTKNKKYQVKYANNFMKNIFSNIKDITKYLEYDGDNISFVLE